MPVKNCFHIRLDGTRCGSPSLKRRNYCYFHFRMLQRAQVERQLPSAGNDSRLELPFLEDLRTVQVALTDVLRAVAAGRIPRDQASLLIRGLRFASQILREEDLCTPSHMQLAEANEETSEREAFDHARLPDSPRTEPAQHSSARTTDVQETADNSHDWVPISAAKLDDSGDSTQINEELSHDQTLPTKKHPQPTQPYRIAQTN